MRVVHGKVGHDDGDGKGDGQHAAHRAQAAHDHAQVSLDEGAEDRWVFLVVAMEKLHQHGVLTWPSENPQVVGDCLFWSLVLGISCTTLRKSANF